MIILLLLFTILLLKSAISEQNPKFLLPWLVAKGISTILQVFVTPYVATLLYADKQTFLLYIFSSIIALGMLFLILHHLTVLRICICNVQMMKFCYFNIYSFAKLFLVGGVQLLQRINWSHQRATRRQHDWKIGVMLQLIKMRMFRVEDRLSSTLVCCTSCCLAIRNLWELIISRFDVIEAFFFVILVYINRICKSSFFIADSRPPPTLK